ncbi:CBS domain-containing protein [Amycolatopsis sp. La24]|uniref:CBS domain-containing protein n=1 Tax=Amycolatopsis sp. La24 TaxID=3028304 RepID=UPI0023AED383|nr:CBS domain-containing protein [Amycolatopsis sp. La24]
MHAWMVRAGSHGEREKTALSDGFVIAGWEEVEDLSHIRDREQLRSLLTETYPDLSPQVIANWTGQLWRFREEIAIDDLVVMPVVGNGPRCLALGVVTGPYSYDADAPEGFRHRRPVQWQRTDLPRDSVRPDLRDSMGSLLTVFELSRNDAARRIAILAEQGEDPGPPDSDADGPTVASPQRLEELVTAAQDSGDAVTLTVRELLGIWGYSRRWPSVVEQVRSELAQRGLSTKPPFSAGSINSRISIVPVGTEPHAGVPVPTAAELPDEPAPEDQPVALLIKQLPSAEVALSFVKSSDSLSVAMTKMAMDNYSQLPILDENRQLRGAVSWESIGLAHLSSAAPTLADAVLSAREADGEDDLLDWISEIYRRGFIFVRGQDRRVQGIVTTADLTNQLGSQLRPFLLIAEIERRLRRIVGKLLKDNTVSIEQVHRQLRPYRTAQVRDADDLTIGEYPHVFKSENTWSAARWSLDKELFLERLRKAASFRNNLMHLNPDLDPESEAELQPLQGLLGMLRALDH